MSRKIFIFLKSEKYDFFQNEIFTMIQLYSHRTLLVIPSHSTTCIFLIVIVMIMSLRKFSLVKYIVGGRNTRLMSTQTQTESDNLVVFEKLIGEDRGIALYGLNRRRDRNALGFELLAAMREVHRLLRKDTGVSVVVIHSLVPGVFCAG